MVPNKVTTKKNFSTNLIFNNINLVETTRVIILIDEWIRLMKLNIS